MTTSSFSQEFGARPIELGFNRLAVVLTDGRSQDEVYSPSVEAMNNGIKIIAVGVSNC